ncbi:MAG: thermonuclease family protein [Burkholderiales bacterium]
MVCAATLQGRIAAIGDGDSLVVTDAGGTSHRVRLAAIDAPELGQAFGKSAQRSLSTMVLGKAVTVEYRARDSYGRIVGKVFSAGEDINLRQIAAGMAWHYKRYQGEQASPERRRYARAEIEARAKRLGLWRDSAPLAPWDFRHPRSGRTGSGVIRYHYCATVLARRASNLPEAVPRSIG